jgi:ABC-type oligopeptide transport system substrate-binding subunit
VELERRRQGLTFKLQEGVKWHDGKPFTAKDVVCTFDLLTGKRRDNKLRTNPRKTWYSNVDKVTANGDYEVTVHLKHPQPSLPSLLASGYSPMYPCHVPAAQMRTKPVGTGPFKFVSFKQNEGIKIERNPDYWKKGKPYLDGIEFTIVPNRGTAMLSFVSGRFDIVFPWEVTIPLLKDIKTQLPNAACQVTSMNNTTNLIAEPRRAAVRQPDLRQALVWRWTARRSSTSSTRATRCSAAPCSRRPTACGACRRDLPVGAGLRPGRRQEPRAGARADEEGGLRARQAPASSRSRPAASRSTRTRR